MKILWFTWKDGSNPRAGGAEVVNEELAKRLVADGHEVIFIVGGFAGGEPMVHKDGYTIIRVGNRYSVYWQAYRYYKKEFQEWPDRVIDEINTMPFFARWYVKQPTILFIHQLCREIWFYQFPFPLSLVGYMVEPVYLWLLRKQPVITISESTKHDLLRIGFRPHKIEVISEGIELVPVASIKDIKKFSQPTMVSLGALRPMKRTLHQLRAFEYAKQKLPHLQLKIAGAAVGWYGRKVCAAIEKSPYKDDIEYLGRVSDIQKVNLLRKAHIITVTSTKEGWGLIVTEAASQGTPAAVYDVDGLRDSVQHRKTGLIACRNTPKELAKAITTLLDSHSQYDKLQENAWRWSQEITFDRSYQQFVKIINNYE